MWNYSQTDWLMHYGRGHLDGGHSGRYPWGSGKKNRDRYMRYGRGHDGRSSDWHRVETKSPAQRARDMSDDQLQDSIKRMKKEIQYVNSSKELSSLEEKKADALDVSKKAVDLSSEMLRKTARSFSEDLQKRQKTVNIDLSKMTDQELREKINRAALEQQFTNYYGTKNVKKGELYVAKSLDTIGDVLAVASSAIAIALAIKGLKNKG